MTDIEEKIDDLRLVVIDLFAEMRERIRVLEGRINRIEDAERRKQEERSRGVRKW